MTKEMFLSLAQKSQGSYAFALILGGIILILLIAFIYLIFRMLITHTGTRRKN
jgi:uncharacterized protein (UPF0333 family)